MLAPNTLNFAGKWLVRNGEEYVIKKIDRPGGLYNRGEEVYATDARDDLRWDNPGGNGFRKSKSIYVYQEDQWNWDTDYDLIERISEKDKRK